MIRLDEWISARVGSAEVDAVKRFQIAKLRECLGMTIRKSRFYRELYAHIDISSIQSFSDLSKLPTICADDLRAHGDDMLCLPGSRIKRVVTSGTTGTPKRLFFSGDDLELTLDFFSHGMNTISEIGDRVLICMNGTSPDSLGDLLSRAVRRFGAIPYVYCEVSDIGGAAEYASRVKPDCIVGIPDQMLKLAERSPELRPKSVLLSADNVPDDLRQNVENIWNCKVYAHWGMRETGLGGGVECRMRDGYHLRYDLIVEILNPEDERGEIVVSTITRLAMPLIRYRTGDFSYIINRPCACGSVLPRLGHVTGHYSKET